jgi:hypothetical protein
LKTQPIMKCLHLKKKEQVLWCYNNILKVNATNNEDAQWNIVEETNQKKKKKKVTMIWWKKVDVLRKEDQHLKKKKKRRILTWNRLMLQTTKGQHCENRQNQQKKRST